MNHPDWSYRAVLYEMNVRQLTPEGTLRAALEAGLTVKAAAPTPEAPSMVKAVDIFITKTESGEEIGDVAVATDPRKEEFLRVQESKLAKKTRKRTVAADNTK